MFTEQTYLFNIFLFLAAIIIAGFKAKSSSKSHEIKKSSTKILVINDGKTGDFPSKVVSYLEKHVTIEMKDIKGYTVEELEAQVRNYSKTILICRIGDRMELYQEKIIKDLDQQIQSDLQVFYLLNPGSGSYCVPGCQAKQRDIFMNEIDERFVKESLKGLIDLASVERRGRLILFFLILLCLGSICGYLQIKSVVREGGDDQKLQDKDREIEKLQAEVQQVYQRNNNLSQAFQRLSEDHLKVKELLQKQEQNSDVLNKELIENQKVIEKLTALISEQDATIKLLENDILSLSQSLVSAQGEIQTYKEKFEKIEHLHEQEAEKIKELEKEIFELKERLMKEIQQHEESKKKLAAQINENDQIKKLSHQFDEELRDLKQKTHNYTKLEERNKALEKQNTVLEKQVNGNLVCRWSLRIQNFFS